MAATAASIKKAILNLTSPQARAYTKSQIDGLSKADLAMVLEQMQSRTSGATTKAAKQAAAQVATQVAAAGGTAAQTKAAAQAAAQAANMQAAMGGRTDGGGKSTSKSRGKSRGRISAPRKSSSAKNRSLAKSRTAISKTKGGGRGRDPSKAKNMDVLRQTLINLGVDASRLKGKKRAALEQMVRFQYLKGKTTKGGGTGLKSSLPKSFAKDYNRIRRLIKDGKIAPVTISGVTAYGVEDVPLSDVKARYEAFFQAYARALKQAGLNTGRGKMGALPKGKTFEGKSVVSKAKSRKAKSRKTAKLKSVKTRFDAIKQQGKVPYYLARGSVRRIGGGPGGPGVVRVVPGTGATPFNKLSEAEKRRVLAYLNTEKGKSLRGKGAKRTVDIQGIINLKSNEKAAAKARRQAAKSRAKSKKGGSGSTNWWN